MVPGPKHTSCAVLSSASTPTEFLKCQGKCLFIVLFQIGTCNALLSVDSLDTNQTSKQDLGRKEEDASSPSA